jgi:RimJ/RimL family protein N-acetyltransferase
MSVKTIALPVCEDAPNLWLHTANETDLSNLREWKNKHRHFFFFNDEITPDQQAAWFLSYQGRPKDFMFMVKLEEEAIGCMGIRLIDNIWDVYNVILGLSQFQGRGLMGKAFEAMLGYAMSRHPTQITLKVLKHNPAVAWYQKNGFLITSEEEDHYSMSYLSDNKEQGLI